MITSKVANWLQILANFGIIAGLIMVGIQINQNTKIAEADLTARSFEQVNQWQLTMMGENPAKALAKAAINPGELTDEELLVLRRVFVFFVNFDTQGEIELDMGLGDRETQVMYWKGRAEGTYGANPVMAAMWEEYRNGNKGDFEWIEIVDEQFQNLEKTDTELRQLQRWREKLQKNTALSN